MKVAYATPFYSGEVEGRFGRFHDWMHTLRGMSDPPFQFEVHASMCRDPDETVVSVPPGYLGDADDLYGTRKGSVEELLNWRRIHSDLSNTTADIVHVISPNPVILSHVFTSVSDVSVVLGPNISGGWSPIRDVQNNYWRNKNNILKLQIKFNLRKLIPRLVNYSRVFAFSKYHSKILQTIGINDSDISILTPGVNDIFQPPSEIELNTPPELLYVGSFSEHKGYPTFLRAVSKIEEPVTARVIGAGDPMKELIKSLGIAEITTVEGFVDRSELPNYYRNADLFVLPSIDEMSPNTQFEALACGTPVVSTDIEGINEWLPESASVLFYPREPDPLAKAIKSGIGNLKQLTEEAMRHSSKFNATNTVHQLNSLYQSIVEES